MNMYLDLTTPNHALLYAIYMGRRVYGRTRPEVMAAIQERMRRRMQ